jgi:acetylglutamate kinase
MEEAIKKADVLIEALPYIQQFSGRPVVIKFGGNAMENAAILDDVLEDVVFLATVGIRAMVVHGGGPQITRAMEQVGLVPRFVAGHRFTDGPALDVVVRVLTEDVNGQIVRCIQAQGGRGRSTFAEGRSPLRARKKLLTTTDESGQVQQHDMGYVGEVIETDVDELLSMTVDGTILAIPPIGQDESGQLYNVNADSAAAAVAGAVGAEKIVFLSNVHGIMADPEDPDSLLSSIMEDQVESLIQRGVITGGMLPKVSACLNALHAGVRKAHIIDGRLPHSLLLEIFTDRGVGTQILKGSAPGAP